MGSARDFGAPRGYRHRIVAHTPVVLPPASRDIFVGSICGIAPRNSPARQIGNISTPADIPRAFLKEALLIITIRSENTLIIFIIEKCIDRTTVVRGLNRTILPRYFFHERSCRSCVLRCRSGRECFVPLRINTPRVFPFRFEIIAILKRKSGCASGISPRFYDHSWEM